MADYKPGSRWQGVVGGGEFVLVRPPKGDGELTCGGAPLVAHGTSSGDTIAAPAGGEGTAVGKRYSEADSSIELLCTKAGGGDLAFAGRPLVRKDAKPLPASD